jgi:uncharacterized BrkB/YihY/UPF0761 family membrane protein
MPNNFGGDFGQYATSPMDLPMRGWGQVVRRVVKELSTDRLSVAAAGVSFYGLLAIFPAIAAFVTLYGLVADPSGVEQQLAPIRAIAPQAAYDILAGQLRAVASQERVGLSVGLLLSLGLMLWSAIGGIRRWILPGAILATLLLIAGSVAFSFYVTNFANYNATFGSLGAVVILLMWFFLSGYAVGLGAELNAELERQTTCDTTVGPPKPQGHRGAYVADHSVHAE